MRSNGPVANGAYTLVRLEFLFPTASNASLDRAQQLLCFHFREEGDKRSKSRVVTVSSFSSALLCI